MIMKRSYGKASLLKTLFNFVFGSVCTHRSTEETTVARTVQTDLLKANSSPGNTTDFI